MKMKMSLNGSLVKATLLAVVGGLVSTTAYGQVESGSFDTKAEGPWSDVQKTTISAPKVAPGAVKLDANISSAEYGNFQAVNVNPGVTGWVLDYPGHYQSSGPNDTSFDFYVAHDVDNLYIGVAVKDDVVNSDHPNASFWNDDAIEVVFDTLNWKFDTNMDGTAYTAGGHNYFNYEGRFSEWDEAAQARRRDYFSMGTDWAYGENEEIFGFGKAVTGGWNLEVRIAKSTLAGDSGVTLDNGYKMGFNIGIDDDDNKQPTADGLGTMELQYFWANRLRAIGWNQAELDSGYFNEQELNNQGWLDPAISPYELMVDSNGRLSGGGTGDLVLLGGNPTTVNDWSLR